MKEIKAVNGKSLIWAGSCMSGNDIMTCLSFFYDKII